MLHDDLKDLRDNALERVKTQYLQLDKTRAGIMEVLAKRHPEWTDEELEAAAKKRMLVIFGISAVATAALMWALKKQ